MEGNYRRLNYKRVLIVVIAIIILLLIIIFRIVSKHNKNIGNQATNINMVEDEIISIAIDNNNKDKKEENKETKQNYNQNQAKQENENNNEETKNEKQEITNISQESNKSQQIQEDTTQEQIPTGIIYLTFDDGPSSDSTPAILDILKDRGVKATFFVLNYNENTEQYIKREYNEGHTIGLHGYTHTYSQVYESADACMENFRKIGERVYQTTGVNSKIIRFPGGSSNTVSRKYTVGIMTEVTARAIQAGYSYFDWNVDSDDAGKAKTSDRVFENVTNGIKPDRENVVLMHDSSGNHKTVNALNGIISWGIEQGYEFKNITSETKMVTHSVNN